MTPTEQASVKKPTSSLDAACMVHDKCHASCRAEANCSKPDFEKRDSCFKACDAALASAASQYGGIDGLMVERAMKRPGSRTDLNWSDLTNLNPIKPGERLWNRKK